MAYEEKEYNKSDYQNDWAKDLKGNPIHIDNAKSGAQGYYCLGCDKEMQGVKFINPNYQSYFRHHAKNIDQEKVECVVASKIYRERIAESILNRLKFVKVPTLYKYPPKGVEGIPMFLQKSKTITASYTKAQEWFYEDENGYIRNGKNPTVEDRYLLIRPDVTFFDEKKNPILFIEFVITHKLETEKLVKLSRLGIDTIQIIIPKVPEDQIEKALKSSRKFKWVYNELEANSTYVQVSEGNSEGIPPIDEEQRKLFEESYSCRAAKINNLVRDINKCIRSESYRRVERLFESELSRLAENRQRAQQRLDDLEARYREEALGRNSSLEEQLRTEEKELSSNIETAEQRLGDLEESNRRAALGRNRGEEEKIESKHTELEGRYFNKNRQLKHGVQDYLSAQTFGIPIERNIEQEEASIKRIEQETNEFDKRIEFEESKMGEEVWEQFSRETERIEARIEQIKGERGNLDIKVQSSINNSIESAERKHQESKRKIEGKIKLEGNEITRIEGEQGNIEERALEEFRSEIEKHSPELSARIKTLLEVRRVANDFENAKCEEEFYRRLEKLIEQKT